MTKNNPSLSLFVVAALTFTPAAPAQDSEILRLAVRGGAAANLETEDGEVSGDGRWILFEADATNLVDGDDNDATDLFLYDVAQRDFELVTRSVAGGTANGSSSNTFSKPAGYVGSDDGRFWTYLSNATDLTLDADNNGESDVLVYDRVVKTNSLISRALGGGAANGRSYEVQMAGDGTVVFTSRATDIVANADSNSADDIFLWDGTSVRLVSKNAGGAAGNDFSSRARISRDANWVVFISAAADLTPDGNAADTQNVFLWNRQVDTLTLVSKATGGGTANGNSFEPVVSANGDYVVFSSDATDLTSDTDTNDAADIFLYDRVADSLTLVTASNARGASTANGESESPAPDDDARWIAFESRATDLAGGTDSNNSNDVFLYDRLSATIQRLSSTPSGDAGSDFANEAEITEDGSLITFRSSASDLTADVDTNDGSDWFRYDRLAGQLELLSISPFSGQAVAPAGCFDIRISRNGLTTTGDCDADDLTELPDGNGPDIKDAFAITGIPFEQSTLEVPLGGIVPTALALLLGLLGAGWIRFRA